MEGRQSQSLEKPSLKQCTAKPPEPPSDNQAIDSLHGSAAKVHLRGLSVPHEATLAVVSTQRWLFQTSGLICRSEPNDACNITKAIQIAYHGSHTKAHRVSESREFVRKSKDAHLSFKLKSGHPQFHIEPLRHPLSVSDAKGFLCIRSRVLHMRHRFNKRRKEQSLQSLSCSSSICRRSW